MYFRSASYAAALLTACSPFALSGAYAQGMAGGNVVAGAAQIVAGQPGQTSVIQSTTKAVVEWQSFSVEDGGMLRFLQPDSQSITLNRVVGDSPSRIDGSIEANGQVWLLNSNGVMIGNNGRINTAGFLATTHSLSDQAFLSSRYDFIQTGVANGSITNGGTIIANGGYAVLAGSQVSNTGLIEANLGQIALGAGKSFTLDLVGDKLLSFTVTSALDVMPANGAAISNSGTLRANGGRVLLTARAAADVVDNVINTSGLIQAQSARFVNGEIVLDGGMAGTVRVDGALDASGTGFAETGGQASVLGDTIILGNSARIDARGTRGGGRIFVGGGWQGASIYGRPSAVRVAAAAGAVLDASAIESGNGGTVVLWSDVHNATSQTYALGSFYAKGGANGGNGGRIETSGRYLSTNGARGSASAPRGKSGMWLFDPTDILITTEGSVGGGGFEPDGDGQLWVPTEDPSRILIPDIEDLLNAGTNVYVTTAGTGSGLGNITVQETISKTSGAEATLSLIADAAIFIYGDITSTSGLNLILESISDRMMIGGEINIDGDLTMRAKSAYVWTEGQPIEAPFMHETGINARNISFTGPDIAINNLWTASDSITIRSNSTEQSIYIGRPPQAPSSFVLDTGEFTNLHAPSVTIGRVDGANNVEIYFDDLLLDRYQGNQTITIQAGGVGGAISFGNGYELRPTEILRLIAGSDITLQSGLNITLGGRLDLISGQRVTNEGGGSVFNMLDQDGRWFISAASPDDVTFGGLISGENALWSTPLANAIGAANNATGNRFAFALSPTITITANNRQKNPSQEIIFTPNLDYTVSGLVNASTYGGAFEQDVMGAGALISSAGASASALPGTYSIDVDTDQLPTGYTLAYAGASVLVNQPIAPPNPVDPPIIPPVVPPIDPPVVPPVIPPVQPESPVIVLLPDVITGGVSHGIPPIPPAPPAAPAPRPNAAPPPAPPPANGGATASSNDEDDEDKRNFLIAPQDPLNRIPTSPVSRQQPPTPRDIADGEDPFLLAAGNNEPTGPAQNADRQGSSVDNVAPGVGVDTSAMPLSPEIPGIEGRFSGTGDSSKW